MVNLTPTAPIQPITMTGTTTLAQSTYQRNAGDLHHPSKRKTEMSESAEERAERIAEYMKPYRTTDDELRKIAAEIRAAESAARATAIADSISAVESRLRAEEKALEDKHKLHGRPVVHERQEYMPYIRTSADIAHVRSLAVAAIQELANE